MLCAVATFRLVAASSDANATRRTATAASASRPNVVFVLTDDLAWSLVTKAYMPHVMQLQRRGITFDHYIVADSLCCPSRTSIFTGLFPHDSGVFGNKGSDGGYGAFQAHGDQKKTFALAMQPRGYRTSMMGKYLNGYGVPKVTSVIPPGWSDWSGA